VPRKPHSEKIVRKKCKGEGLVGNVKSSDSISKTGEVIQFDACKRIVVCDERKVNGTEMQVCIGVTFVNRYSYS